MTMSLGAEPLIRWSVTRATGGRVLTQLRHDPRTVAMMLAVPAVMMILLRYVLDNPLALDRIAPEFIGVFPFVACSSSRRSPRSAKGRAARLSGSWPCRWPSSICWPGTRSRSASWRAFRWAWCC